MCDLFEEVERVEVTIQKNLFFCNVTFIERPETKVIIVGPDVLFFDETFRNTHSYKHGSNILQACAPAKAVLLFFLDEQGFMSIYLPGACEPAYTGTNLGKIHDLQLVTTSPATFDLLLRSEDSFLICRDLNTMQLHSELTERKFEELEEHFRSTQRISVVGKVFFCSCSSPALLWNIQLTSPGIITAYTKESHGFYIRNLFDPLSVIEEDIRFRKVSLISDSVYCMALTSSGQLYLLNLFAGVCLGSLSQFSNVNDFFICQSISKIPVNSTSEYSGLCEATIFILRDLEENDQPSCTGPTKLLEVVLFPSYQIIHKIHVTKESWLLSNYDLGDYKSEGIALPETSVLYAELHSNHSDNSTENCLLSIKALKETNPKQRLEHLLKLEKFEEARLLVKSFNLDSSDFQLVVLTELQFIVNAIHKQEDDVNPLYARLLECLQEVEMLWKTLEIVDSIAEITIPNSDDQMKLLLILKEKLITDNLESISPEHQERGTKVLRLLKRLKAFLLIYRSSSYTPEAWITFRDANVDALFTNLSISKLQHDQAASLDQAFLLWMMYKGELTQFLTWDSLKILCSTLSKRPLTYTLSCEFTDEHNSRESELIESEEAVHNWLRNELLPLMIKQCPDTLPLLVDFLVSRVRDLEACSLKSPSGNHRRDEKVKCPFPWPSTAISWINNFLESVNIPESNSEENSINTIALSDLYFSGLASRNPDLDPFYKLRKLAGQLDTIKRLSDVYNFHLSIDSCEDETDLSIAYGFLDTAFNLSIPFDKGVDKLTAQYLKDKNIDYQTFLQAYSSHLINRIPSSLASENDDPSETPPFRMVKLNETPKSLIQRACLVTSWITLPLCRIKAVLNLTSVVPLPWTDSLFQLSEDVLKQTCISNSQSKYLDGLTQEMHSLEFRYNKARLYKIYTRYELENFINKSVETHNCLWLTDQIISRILKSTEGPFGVNTSFSTPKISSDDSVYRDAVTVTKILLSEYKWPWLLAQLYMKLTLFKTMEQKEADLTSEYESRISFFISHLNFCANETLYQLVNQSNKLNDTTQQFMFIRNWLIQLAFRSFKQFLNHGNILFSFQRSLIVDLGLSLAVLKSTSEQEKNMTQMNWISLMKFTKLYFPSSSTNNDEHISDGSEESIILQLFSNDKLLPALLSDRLILIRRLTKLYVERLYTSTVFNEIDNLFNIPIKLRTCYSYLLVDISNGVRDELMHWEWFGCLCSTICSSIFSCESDNDNDPNSNSKLNDPNLIISRSLQVQSVLMKLTEILPYNVRQPCVYTVRDKSKHEIGENLTKSNDFVSKCAYCNCIWNQRLARFGCIIELYRQSILPFLSKSLELLHFMELNTYKSIINIIHTVFNAFSSLLLWSIGEHHFNSLIEKNCVCPLLASTNEFQALRQIIEAFSNVFNQIGRTYQKLEMRDKDLLECVFYTSVYHEQTTKDILRSRIHSSQFSKCLKWLSSLLECFIPFNSCDSSNRINNNGKEEAGGGEGEGKEEEKGKENDEEEQLKKNEYKVLIHRLLEDGMAIASNWSSEFGLYLTGAHSLLIGILNLFQSSVIQNMWSDSFIIDFTGKRINDDTITKCLNLCVKCLSSSLKSVLNPVDGKYLDQSLALCLSLALPIDEADSIVRDVVAHSKRTPKKVKALANIIFMFSQITLRFGLELLPLSQNMAKMWTWDILLKPYKLDFSRIMMNGMENTLLEGILDKLCRMIPSWKEKSAYLLPSDTHSKLALPKPNSCIERSLPSLELIIKFSKDFNIPLKEYLLRHLKALLRTSYETSVNSIPHFETLIHENSDQSLSVSTDSMNNSKLQRFIRYQKLCLSRAHTILKLLFRSAKQSNDPQSSLRDLAKLIHSYYASTSPYDYERLSFIYSWIRACVGKGMITKTQIKLLYHLRYYRRVCPPRDSEFKSISTGDCKGFIFSKGGSHHPMCRIRMPYHQLLTDSFPCEIIGPEVTLSTVNFWLSVNRIMQWSSSDVIKIAAAQNLVNHYSTVGLLPITNSYNISEESTVSRSVGWDRALPCQNLIEPLFGQLFNLLESVTSTSTVYSLLSDLARQVIYGPHRLMVLKLAHDLAEVYLTAAENRARQFYSQNVSLSKESAEDKSLDSDDCENEVYKSVQFEQNALEETKTSYKQLAIEGCLYKYHLAYWEEVNKPINSPFELILNLLYKTASCLQRSATDNCKSELPISDLFLRRQIDEALPNIAHLVNINLMDIARYVIVNRVKIPSHVFKNHQLFNETCITNRSLSLDMTFGAGELTPDDISFNATMYESPLDRVSSSADNQTSNNLEPTEADFMLAELILSQAQIKQELLSILEAFVFNGTPDQYISAKWRATRCILRCENGCYLRPKLSMVELRAALLRLSTLASCSTSMYQQLLCDASVSCTSSRGDTYSSLHPSRLENSIKQLLITSSNNLTALNLTSHLILHYELLSFPILKQLFESVHHRNAQEVLDIAFVLLTFIQSTGNVNESMKWFFLNPVKQNSLLHSIISSLIEKLFLRIMTPGEGDPRKIKIQISRLLYFLISWPFPDKEIENIFVQFSHSVDRMLSQQSMRVSDLPQQSPVLLAIFLHLLASSASNPQVSDDLNAYYKQIVGGEDKQNTVDLIRDAMRDGEILLTPKFLCYP